MGTEVRYMAQGACAKCGSKNIEPKTIVGGRPGENILALFECRDCECKYMEVYEYARKVIDGE